MEPTAPGLSDAGTRAGALVSVPLEWEGHRPASLPGPVSETLGARGPLQPQTFRALKSQHSQEAMIGGVAPPGLVRNL